MTSKQKLVVLVTGASEGGIGSGLTRAFKKRGCRVFGSVRSESKIGKQEEEGIEFVILHQNNKDSIMSAIDEIISKAGRLDVLVNNAGVQYTGPTAEYNLQGVRDTFETNVFGILEIIQYALPKMKSGSKIVNVGSVVGFNATPWAGAYCASKSALHAFNHCLRMELAPFGIDVLLVLPGAIRSNIADNALGKIKLPPNSKYQKYAPYIEARTRASQHATSTPNDVFGLQVADEVLKAKPNSLIWAGEGAWNHRLYTFLPLGYFQGRMMKAFGLKAKL